VTARNEPRILHVARYPQIMAAIICNVWAIIPEKLMAMLEFMNLKQNGVIFTAAEVEERIGSARKRTYSKRAAGTAVIPVHGTIAHRIGLMSDVSGGVSTESLARDFDDALKDDEVGTIVFDIDSPGGTVAGLQELSDKIYKARGKKRTVAVANGEMASAAYFIGSAADEVVAAPSSELGSIGTIAVHTDFSGAYDAAGIKPTIIKAGKYKGEGNELEPLGDEAAGELQRKVDAYYGQFVSAVARNRNTTTGTVRTEFGGGRMLMAKEAVQQGLADRIATLETVLAENGARATSSNKSSAWNMAKNLDIRKRKNKT